MIFTEQIQTFLKNIYKNFFKKELKQMKNTKINVEKENSLSHINSQTAKNGLKEEQLVCDDLNNKLIKSLSTPILGNYNHFEKISGHYKYDIASKDIRIQVKKFKEGQFQQLDRHWTSHLIENIPELEDASQILKDLFELPLQKGDPKSVDKSKEVKILCNSNYSQSDLDNFFDLLNKFKRQILEYGFYGTNKQTEPKFIIGSKYKKKLTHLNKTELKNIFQEKNLKFNSKTKNENLVKLLKENGIKDEEVRLDELVVFKIDDIINYLVTLDFKCGEKKTRIVLGEKETFSIQRKGGEKGGISSNQFQMKIILSNLIDEVDCVRLQVRN